MTDISAIIKIFMEPGLKSDRPAQPALRPGSMLTGKVTDVLPSGLVQVKVGNFRTQARIKFPVAKGDALRFEVLETGDPIKLKVQQPPPAAARAPLERFFKPEDLALLRQSLDSILQKPGTAWMDRGLEDGSRQLLSRLNRQLQPLALDGKIGQLAPQIKSILANSGLFFEKRLATVLLQIFQSPDSIDTARAVSHPFVTHIFDNDLKPILLKLATALPGTPNSREPSRTYIQALSRKLLAEIDSEQARITRQAAGRAPSGTGTYRRTDVPLKGRPGAKSLPPDSVNLKSLELRLARAGLWSDPEIRATVRGFVNHRGSGPTARSSAPHLDRSSLQGLLERLMGDLPALPSRQLASAIRSFHTYTRDHHLRLDTKTEAALSRLADMAARPGHGAGGTTGNGPAYQTEKVRAQLNRLARFLDNQPRPASLVESRAADLNAALDRIDKALADLLLKGVAGQGRKALLRTIFSLQALIDRHQLPVDEAVNRALAALGSERASAKTVPASTPKVPSALERISQELMVLREFIGQQKAELHETLDMLKGLLNRLAADADTGDRPGQDRGRGADPMQVVAFSLPLEEEQAPARLKVYYPLKKRPTPGNGFQVSLLLFMDRMGSIRADIFTYQNHLDVKFSTENESARQHIAQHLDRLNSLLGNYFDTVNLMASVDTKTIGAFEYEDLEIPGNRLVDLKA